ncbi:MAG: hypothetical protein R2800_05125 [Flavipsychrobacter sp.]
MLLTKHIKNIAVILFIFSANNICAQETLVKNSSIDDSLINQKIKELRNSIDEYDNATFDFGKINYAPDSSFKILTIYGETCGAYCHNTFQTYIYYKKGEKIIESDIQMPHLSEITDIIKFKNTDSTTEYLIFDKRYVRPRSVETGTEVSFSHLVFFKGEPKFNEINTFNKEGALFKELNVYFYSSENMCMTGDESETPKGVPPTLSYQPKTMTITYEHAQISEELDYPCKYITGTYRYTNGIFINN